MKFDTTALTALAHQQGLPVSDAVQVVSAALTDAYAKTPGAVPGAVAVVDLDACQLRVEAAGVDVTPAGFGRLAANTTRQALVQWIRDVERRRQVGPWANREGTVVLGTVKANPARNRRGEVVFTLDGATGVMPAGEAIPGEELAPGQQVAVLALAANVDDRVGVLVTVSRRQPALVSALFEQVVPELAGGQVEIVAIARDPGSRTKVAVRGEGVDPVAAMVGPGGYRARQVTEGLVGERVDLVRHQEDLGAFVAAALTPGQVAETVVDPVRRNQVTVKVRTDQIALVRGRADANLRLAQRLTGAKIVVDPVPSS